jgi:hypothetical protein
MNLDRPAPVGDTMDAAKPEATAPACCGDDERACTGLRAGKVMRTDVAAPFDSAVAEGEVEAGCGIDLCDLTGAVLAMASIADSSVSSSESSAASNCGSELVTEACRVRKMPPTKTHITRHIKRVHQPNSASEVSQRACTQQTLRGPSS